MAPGCYNTNVQIQNTDTIDSFEILEQTVMKQKRLAKKKKCDLRLRILLKRTFDLVCEIMDKENGFDDDDSSNSSSKINNDYSNYSSAAITTTTAVIESTEYVTTTIERPIEAIPLPPEEDYEEMRSIQLVPNDEQVIKLDDNKEYHMLTNVQTDFFNNANINNSSSAQGKENSFKRKFDHDDVSSVNSHHHNKKKLKKLGGSNNQVNKQIEV